MIEVEAKIKISNQNEFREKIKYIAKFVKREKKIDDYYTLQPLNSYPTKSLRIRKRGKTYEINFKQKLSYMKGIHAKNEHEFYVSDIIGFLNLIKDFGFKLWLRKEKITELYKIKNNFHIEINKVKNLGWFLEVEYLSTKKNINKAREQVLNIIKKLEIDKKDLVADGYTKMLWDKKQLGV